MSYQYRGAFSKKLKISSGWRLPNRMTKADLINELNKLATQVSDSLENAKVLVNELKAMETALENLPDDADDIEDDVKDDE